MNDSGLTNNAWVKRVGELRQMLDDAMTPDFTAEDVEWYSDNVWELQYSDEREFMRREFGRRFENPVA